VLLATIVGGELGSIGLIIVGYSIEIAVVEFAIVGCTVEIFDIVGCTVDFTVIV